MWGIIITIICTGLSIVASFHICKHVVPKATTDAFNKQLEEKAIQFVDETINDLTYTTEKYIPGKTYSSEEYKNVQYDIIESIKNKIKKSLKARIGNGELKV